MLVKLCARCQCVVQAPATYCNKCRDIMQKQIESRKQYSNTRYNKQRDKKYIQFYNSKAWRTLSKEYIKKIICVKSVRKKQS